MVVRQTPVSRNPAGLQRRLLNNFLLGLLLGVIFLEGVIAVTRHRSDAEWHHAWQQGTVEQRLLALHVLANRSRNFKPDQELVRQLLSEPDPRLREFAFFSTSTRFQVKLLRDYLAEARESPVRLRQHFLLEYRPGGGRTMLADDLRRFLESLEERPSESSDDHDE